jgi:hypothetical protein
LNTGKNWKKGYNYCTGFTRSRVNRISGIIISRYLY